MPRRRRRRRRAARSGQVGPVPHQRRPPRPRGVRAQALAARLPGVARRGPRASARRCSSGSPRPHRRGSAFVVGAQALVDHVADAGLRGSSTARRSPPRADVVVVGGHDAARLRGAQDRHPGRVARRRADRRDARRHLPDAGRPVAGHGRHPRRDRDRHGPQGRPRDRQARAADVRGGARPPRRRPRRSRSATGWTPTRRRASAPAWTRRSSSPARRRAWRPSAADPKPTYVADSLAALVLA